MRRTTYILLGILAVGLVAILYALKAYTEQFAEEIRRAKEVSEQVADRLEPGTRVKLARVGGMSRYVVQDPERFGLLVEAQPQRDLWAKDPRGEAFARDLAGRLLATYGPERPVTWLQFRLALPDGSDAPRFGLELAPDGTLRRLEVPAPK